MIVLSRIDYTRYNSPRFIYPALAITSMLLVVVLFFRDSHHTHRWIRFGSLFTFQPSEIAKPVIILFLAWFLSTRLDQMRDWRNTLLKAALMPVVFMLLIVKQPDLGTALVVGGVTAMLLLLAGMEWKYLVLSVAAAAPGLAALLFWVPWRRARMLAFMHPDLDPQGAGFHVNQSLIAVGTGGFMGRGYMEGMQKLFYLPEASTDFIYANIAEESSASCRRDGGPYSVRGARLSRTAHRLPVHGSVCAPHRLRTHDRHSASGLLQHQRGALTAAHQGNSVAIHLLRRNEPVLHAGGDWDFAEYF